MHECRSAGDRRAGVPRRAVAAAAVHPARARQQVSFRCSLRALLLLTRVCPRCSYVLIAKKTLWEIKLLGSLTLPCRAGSRALLCSVCEEGLAAERGHLWDRGWFPVLLVGVLGCLTTVVCVCCTSDGQRCDWNHGNHGQQRRFDDYFSDRDVLIALFA